MIYLLEFFAVTCGGSRRNTATTNNATRIIATAIEMAASTGEIAAVAKPVAQNLQNETRLSLLVLVCRFLDCELHLRGRSDQHFGLGHSIHQHNGLARS
jgi:hypothetical protein